MPKGTPITDVEMVGKTFNGWLVLERDPADRKKWRCRCVCQRLSSVEGKSLRDGSSKSCGKKACANGPCKVCGNNDDFSFDEKSGKRRCRPCVNKYKANRYRDKPEKRFRLKDSYARRYKLYRRYGILMEQYEELFEKQRGVCAICGHPELRAHLKLVVDHDHKSNRVRGLLCHRCNSALGIVDRDEWLRKAMIYLGYDEPLFRATPPSAIDAVAHPRWVQLHRNAPH